tara:strand:- start:440 stop:1453 length:1014 start_codon:yes stop_codon:yes gene_type:complete
MSKENGLSGLANLGNTCYINSVLQILSHTKDLEKSIKNIKLNNCVDNVLLNEWLNLQKLLWHKNCVIKPNKFLGSVHSIANHYNNDYFNGFDQNDASEFILFLFESFHKSCKTSVEMTIKGTPTDDIDKLAIECYKSFIKQHQHDYSVIIKLFYSIQIVYNIKVIDNKTLSYSCQSNFIINLPINKTTNNLYDCFNYYMKDELLQNDNALIDEKDNKKYDVNQKTKFWNLPEILVICIKRFSFDGKKKENKLIDFPINNLDLSKYVIGYNKNNNIYDLYGVCNHSGRLQGGHYTSYVKTTNDNWYHFNDTIVSKLNNHKTIISPKAYCLFYKKKILN